MNESESSKSRFEDDRLADFADRLLAGEAKQIDPNVDDELRSLEQTVLRLQQAFPKQTLEPARLQQMQARLNQRINREKAGQKPTLLQKWLTPSWQTQRAWQRTGLVLAGVAVLAALIIIPSLQESSPATPGAAGLNPPVIIAVLTLLAAVGLALWLSRRK